MREESRQWIRSLTKAEKKAIKKYTFNGIDNDNLKLYQKINGLLLGRYKPKSKIEENMLFAIIYDIETGISKCSTKEDIILFRSTNDVSYLEGPISTVLSTSVTTKGVLGGVPDIEIIAPKGTRGAYVELLSRFPKQREFILHSDNYLVELYGNGEFCF